MRTLTLSHKHSPTRTSHLSPLNESSVFGKQLELVHASNATLLLRDEEGKEKQYLDFMSAYGSVNFGHCNPHIQPYQSYDADIAACFYPAEAESYSTWLCEQLNYPEHQLLFQVGGSFAVSTAIAMAYRMRPGKIVAINGAFHGLGVYSIDVTMAQKNIALQQTDMLHKMDRQFIHIDQGEIPEKWDDISCIIYEPIQGANGYIPLNIDWLRELEIVAKQHGVFMISDEIQCGYFRHGSLSPSRHHGLHPDIILFSKSMTNGLFPFSAVVYPSHFNECLQMPIALAHTFQTSALGCYAVNAVKDYLDKYDILQDVHRISAHFQQQVLTILEVNSNISNIHLTGPTLSFEVTNHRSKGLVHRCAEQGVLIFSGGVHGERVRIAPPLTTPIDQLILGTSVLLEQVEAIRN